MKDRNATAKAAARTWLSTFGRSPIYAAVVSLLAVVTGFVGSLFSPEIKAAFPFYWGSGRFSWEAALFWGFLVGTGLLYWWRQVVVDRDRKGAEDALLGQSNKLEELIRTLPPGDFLEAFGRNYSGCSGLVYDLLVGHEEERERATVESALQTVLLAMAGLARHYDGTPDDVVYGSNLMTYMAGSEIPNPVPGHLEEAARFLGGTIEEKRGELQGVLWLRSEYSGRVPGDATSGDTPDPSLRALVLPIPRTEKTVQGAWRVLPGAPLAFCRKRPNGYEDTATMATFCEVEGDFPPSVIQELRGYFGEPQSQGIKSLVSLPVLSPRDSECLGIVNIHRDRPNILKQPDAQALFFGVMGPFCVLVAYLIEILEISRQPELGDPDGMLGDGDQPADTPERE